MTYAMQSFQPLCNSNKQLFCLPAQLDSQNLTPATLSPPDTRAPMLWGQAYFTKTNTYHFVELQADMTWQTNATGSSSKSI